MNDNCPGGPVGARALDGRFHRRPSAVEERRWWNDRQPPVSELALADALECLVVMINELRIDVGLCVEATVDDASLVKLTFSGTPDTGFPLQREVKDFPGAGGPPVSGTRDCATTKSSSPAVAPEKVRSLQETAQYA